MGQAEGKQQSELNEENESHRNTFDLLRFLDSRYTFQYDVAQKKVPQLIYQNPDHGFYYNEVQSPQFPVSEDSDSFSNTPVSPTKRKESVLRFQSPFLYQRSTSCEPFVNNNRLPDELDFTTFKESHSSGSTLDILEPDSHRLEHLEPFIRRSSFSPENDSKLTAEYETAGAHTKMKSFKQGRNIRDPIAEIHTQG